MDTQHTRHQHKTVKHLIKSLSFCLMLCSQTVMAQLTVETIPLKHSLAEEILPHIQAILPPDAVISAFNNTLIVKADKPTLKQIHQLLDQIDIAQQAIRVTVFKTDSRIENEDGHQTSIDARVGDQTDIKIAHKRWSSHQASDQNQEFNVRGISGQPLSIQMGVDHPLRQQLVFVSPLGYGVVNDNTHYISADNGFKTIATLLADNQVRVEIYPYFADIDHRTGTIDSSEMVSTITGSLNDWIEIGRVSNQIDGHSTTSQTYTSSSSNELYLYLKVEAL